MRQLLRLTALLVVAATACGSSSPSSGPSPSASVSPTPTPTLPPVATDQATAKGALVTAAELGAPWVVQKSVNTQKGKTSELCPGVATERTVVPPRADADVKMTEGTKTGAGIGTFRIQAFAFGRADAWRTAFFAASGRCAAYKAADGTYVTLESLTSLPATTGADEVIGRFERVYADAKHAKLYYVRPTLFARFGRVVVSVQYAYIQPKTDPTGKDLTRVTALLAKQLAKAQAAFGA